MYLRCRRVQVSARWPRQTRWWAPELTVRSGNGGWHATSATIQKWNAQSKKARASDVRMLHSHATIPLWGAWTSLQEPGTKRQWSGGCWRRSVINMAYATPNQIATSAIATTLTPTPSASITSHLCREMTFSRRHLLLTYLFMRAEPDLHWNNFTYSIHLIATCFAKRTYLTNKRL